MATSNLVQFLQSGEGAKTSYRAQEETYFAGGTIAVGDWVAFDVSKTSADKTLYVVATPAAAGRGNVVGVAISAAASGEKVTVTIKGYVSTAKVAAGTAQNASLTTSATAGTAVTYATGTHTGTGPCGVALTAESSGVCEAYVFGRV